MGDEVITTTHTTPLYTRTTSASGRHTYTLHTAYCDYDHEAMTPGTCHLVIASGDGMRRYAHDVTPDTAGWVAAAELARVAMEDAIRERSKFTPSVQIKYTKRQQEVLAHCKKLMADAGMLMPSSWTSATPHEISQAAIDAVKGYKP